MEDKTINSYISLTIATLLPVGVTSFLGWLKKKGKFDADNSVKNQIFIGVIFGGLAVLGTEWGIPINGAQINCRDAAVLCSGLFFGPVSGIVAGIIGGVERWIAVAWGVGSFTRLACSVSTIIAGFYSAFLRKYLFERRKPEDIFALASGVVMEVFHMTMVFLTNMEDTEMAISVVKTCTIPMVVANATSVMLASIALKLVIGGKSSKTLEKRKKRISTIIQKAIFCVVCVAFFVTTAFVYQLQDGVSIENVTQSLSLAIEDVVSDMEDAHELKGKDANIEAEIIQSVRNRHVGKNGYMIITTEKHDVVSGPTYYEKDNVEEEFESIELNGNTEEMTLLEGVFQEDECYCMYQKYEGYIIMAIMTKAEALQMRNVTVYANTFMEVLAFAVLFALVSIMIQHTVVLSIHRVNASLKKITEGDLDEVINVGNSREFYELSTDINTTVGALKEHIAEAAARIDADLKMATEIQMSALPQLFPAFPKRKDFDIYACTAPAKEVGGDFYDLYMTHSRYLNILIADVSGKGIPAAMFMMRAKTTLQSLTKTDLFVDEVFTEANNSLCEGNDAGMFVTAWQGGIDLRDGVVEYANAGHNPPVVKHKDGKFEYLKSKVNLVLAGMGGVPYKRQELKLEPGDIIFLYTDGITEATNANNELYGEDRLLNILNSRNFIDMHDICDTVRADVDKFVADAPQFDDMTMLAFKYYGHDAPRWFALKADRSEVPGFTNFIDAQLEKMGCPMRANTQIDVAIDEIMTNIASYAYGGKYGRMGIVLTEINTPKHGITLSFVDAGTEYDPLSHKDPDTTLSAEERDIGGLGILMVKKTMDDVRYERVNNTNVLTITKYFEKENI